LIPKEKWPTIRAAAIEMSRGYAALWGGAVASETIAA
jgi:hypothetical protein